MSMNKYYARQLFNDNQLYYIIKCYKLRLTCRLHIIQKMVYIIAYQQKKKIFEIF